MARQRFAARKEKQWAGIGGTGATFTANITTALVGISFAGTATIMRILGGWSVKASGDAAVVQGDSADIVVAVGVFSTDAFTLGGTAMPDPVTDESFPWLYWKGFSFWSSSGSTASAMMSEVGVFDIDVKGMRKVKPSETLGVVVQYFDRVGAPNLRLDWYPARVLLTST